jgi:hypothetical protein
MMRNRVDSDLNHFPSCSLHPDKDWIFFVTIEFLLVSPKQLLLFLFKMLLKFIVNVQDQ